MFLKIKCLKKQKYINSFFKNDTKNIGFLLGLIILILFFFIYISLVDNMNYKISNLEIIEEMKKRNPYLIAKICIIYIDKQFNSVNENEIKSILLNNLKNKEEFPNYDDFLNLLKTNNKLTIDLVNKIPISEIDFYFNFIDEDIINKYKNIIKNKKKKGKNA